VDLSAPPARISRMLEAARPTDVVLAQDPPAALAEELVTRGIRTITLDPLAADLTGTPTAAALPAHDPDGPAYIVFTSAPTGYPKGVPIPHAALAPFADGPL